MFSSTTILASEMLFEAFSLATQLWREGSERPDTTDWPPENAAIVKSLLACVDQGLWNDRLANVTQSDCENLVAQLRHFALTQRQITDAPDELARQVAQVAVFLRDRIDLVPDAVRWLPQVALQIATSLMSLIKQHELTETALELCDNVETMRRIIAWSPCDHESLSAKRFDAANLPPSLRLVRDQVGRNAALWATCFAPNFDKPWLEQVQRCLADKTETDTPRERLENWFDVASRFSYASQLELLQRLPGEAQTAWLTRLMALNAFETCSSPDDVHARLKSLSSLESALGALLLHDFGALSVQSSRDITSDLLGAWHTIRALAAIMQNQPWEDAFLRQTVCVPSNIPFWPNAASCFYALRAQAFCVQNAPELALQDLSNALQIELCDALICAAFVHAHTLLGHFGEAQQWLARAEEFGESDQTRNLRRHLARRALSSAKRAPIVDASLLELALQLGDGPVVAEAALCWFDADLPHLDLVANQLAQNVEARRTFIEVLLHRPEITRLDALSELADALNTTSNERQSRCEAAVLQALARLDNPDDAYQRLADAIDRWPDSDRTATNTVFWKTTEKYIELGASCYAFDEMARSLSPAFAIDSLDARHLLKCFLAQTPRNAVPGVQQAILETLGRDLAITLFTRLKQQDAPAPTTLDASQPTNFVSSLPDVLQAPPLWQLWAHVGARLRPRVVAEAPTKREIARQLMMQSREKMPEPPKAEWIHTKLGKASDAFKN